MKTKKIILGILIFVLLSTISCNRCHGLLQRSYIYISGEKGKKVHISYIDRGDKKNEVVNKTVELPFMSPVRTFRCDPQPFLSICTTADDTITKGAIFTDLSYSSGCSMDLFYQMKIAKEDGDITKQPCGFMADLPLDSAFAYMKKINYPNVIEFKGGETCKRIELQDWKE